VGRRRSSLGAKLNVISVDAKVIGIHVNKYGPRGDGVEEKMVDTSDHEVLLDIE